MGPGGASADIKSKRLRSPVSVHMQILRSQLAATSVFLSVEK